MLTIVEALAEAARQAPELETYYALHRSLVAQREAARQAIPGRPAPAEAEALAACTQLGRPLLTWAQLPIEASRLADQARAVAEALTLYDPDLGGQSLPAEAAEWVALARQAFSANQAVPETPGPAGLPAASLAELAAAEALKPYLEWAAEQLLLQLDLRQWQRNYCPVCGSPPDFAFLAEETGGRQLGCPRCDSQWLYRRLGCPFCETSDLARISYYPSANAIYRLYVCQACQRYLKTRDLRQGGTRLPLTAERISTVAMDMAAREKGYR